MIRKALPTITRILTILAVVALAWGLRRWANTHLPIDYDEDDYLRAAQEYAALVRTGDWAGFLETNYRPEHPPLNKIVFGLAILPAPQTRLISDRPTTAEPASILPPKPLQYARLSSAVFGTLEVALLALISPLAGLFLAIHTFTIKYTSQVMLEALPAFLSLAAVMTYARSRERPKHRRAWLILAAICLGLTAASKYLYAVAGFAILADWALHTRDDAAGRADWPGWLRSALPWGLLAIGVFLLADPYLWPDPLGRLADSLGFHTWYTANAAEVQRSNFPFWQPLVWLAQSVPWHEGVFFIAIDGLIALLALTGLPRLWRRGRVYVLWLAVGLAFLLVWPTKWPQYILILTAPVALAASEGVQTLLVEPVRRWQAAHRIRRERPLRSVARREIRRALPWLAPGLLAFTLLTLFPLIFQLAMAMTDLTSLSIRDGLNGGIFREVWLGLTGQVAPLLGAESRQVHYTGLLPMLFGLLFPNKELLVFELLWTTVSVGLQTALGLGVALLLAQRGLRLKRAWQVLFILPWAIPESVGVMMWAQVVEPRFGWLSLAGQGFPARIDFPLPYAAADLWRSDPSVAFFVLLVPAVWYGFPFMLLAASAGLKLVPREVYDAAALDGAGAWQTFRGVTWPLVLPLLLPAVIIRAIFAFNQFYLFQVLSPPWPLATLAQISFNLLDPSGYAGGQFATSAVLNILTAVILVGFVAVLNRWGRGDEGEYA